MKATSLGCMFRTGVDVSPTSLDTPNKLCHTVCLCILLPDMVWEGLVVLLWILPKPPNTAQVRPIFKHEVALCCWVELCSYLILYSSDTW
jgi:hypothetical protein